MKSLRKTVLLIALLSGPFMIAVPSPTHAQAGPQAAAQAWPDADPDDVESIDTIIAALYDVISGPAGEKRDWDRFRSLMVPEARLIPTGLDQTGRVRYRPLTPGDYVDGNGASLEARGFFEVEIARTTERFGPIAHAFSTYESRWTPDDAEPFDRGINSIQLLHDGTRWWIMNIFWSGDRDDLPIPEKYLPGGR